MKVLVDFHHSALLRSLICLFEDRLGMEVYRPIGREWYDEGFWAVHDHPETVMQYLGYEQTYRPPDGTPPLNQIESVEDGVFNVMDPGGLQLHRACTLDYFKDTPFDLVVSSLPQHHAPFQRLVGNYQPGAYLVDQVGNDGWPFDQVGAHVLASIKPHEVRHANVLWYHQEFPLGMYRWSAVQPSQKIFSYINFMQNDGRAWRDFREIEQMTEWDCRSYGGACRDGSLDGQWRVADSMRESQFVFHVKSGGDGFGHVLYGAYAVGRPVILRSSMIKPTLGNELLQAGNHIDLDRLGKIEHAVMEMGRLTANTEELMEMGMRAGQRFREVVDYPDEAQRIKTWLSDVVMT